jgi:hypothetical protein
LFLLALNVFTIVERERGRDTTRFHTRAAMAARLHREREGERESIEQTNPFVDCASKP